MEPSSDTMLLTGQNDLLLRARVGYAASLGPMT